MWKEKDTVSVSESRFLEGKKKCSSKYYNSRDIKITNIDKMLKVYMNIKLQYVE